MSDEQWGTYGAYQEAARDMLAALEAVAGKFARVKPGHGYFANTLAIQLTPDVQAAIAKAKAAGVKAGD